MKKQIFTRILVATMLASVMATSAFAVADKSVERRPAPAVVQAVSQVTGEEVAAVAYDENGEEIGAALAEQVIITPIAQADQAEEHISEPLQKAFEEIKEATSIVDLNPSIVEVAQAEMPEVPVEKLVVRDLFDVTLPEELEQHINNGDGHVAMTFDLGVHAQEKVLVMVQCDGVNWTTVSAGNVKNNADGSVSVDFDQFCPIAFVVQESESATPLAVSGEIITSPQTGAPHAVANYALLVMLFGCGAVVLMGLSLQAKKCK